MKLQIIVSLFNIHISWRLGEEFKQNKVKYYYEVLKTKSNLIILLTNKILPLWFIIFDMLTVNVCESKYEAVYDIVPEKKEGELILFNFGQSISLKIPTYL